MIRVYVLVFMLITALTYGNYARQMEIKALNHTREQLTTYEIDLAIQEELIHILEKQLERCVETRYEPRPIAYNGGY